ncbi:MAG: hypothetical protein ABIJ09_06110 [Pseudomonadota bacterium]
MKTPTILATTLFLFSCGQAMSTFPKIQENRVHPPVTGNQILFARCSSQGLEQEFRIFIAEPDAGDDTFIYWYFDFNPDTGSVNSRPFFQETFSTQQPVREASPALVPRAWIEGVSPTATHIVEVLVTEFASPGSQAYLDFLEGARFDYFYWRVALDQASCF